MENVISLCWRSRSRGRSKPNNAGESKSTRKTGSVFCWVCVWWARWKRMILIQRTGRRLKRVCMQFAVVGGVILTLWNNLMESRFLVLTKAMRCTWSTIRKAGWSDSKRTAPTGSKCPSLCLQPTMLTILLLDSVVKVSQSRWSNQGSRCHDCFMLFLSSKPASTPHLWFNYFLSLWTSS